MDSSEPLLVNTGKGFNVTYRSRSFYSSLNPLASIKKRIGQLAIASDSLVYIPSLGLGYGLEEILERIPESCYVLCVEVDQTLMRFALDQDKVILPEAPRLLIVRADDPAAVVRYLRDKAGIGKFRRVKQIHLCTAYHLYREKYDEIGLRLEQEIQDFWKNKITLIHMGRLWVKNILRNLEPLARSQNLTALTTDLPVCVLGAGPSLESSLSVIHEMQDRMLILAVDTSLPVLSKVGIKPDLVLALESQVANLQDFIGQDLEGIPLLCDITSCPTIVRLFTGRACFFSSRFFPLALLRRMDKENILPLSVPALGSVGVTALNISLKITSGAVIMAGLDFGYIRNQTHSKDAPFHQLMLREASRLYPAGQLGFETILKRPLLRLKGRKGQKVLSDLVLHSYAIKANELLENESRVYDLGCEGLISEAEPIDDQDTFRKLLPPAPHSGRKWKWTEKGISKSGRRKAGSLKEFIRGETELLDQGMIMLKSIIRNRKTGTRRILLSKELETTLQELDYLYYYFPDTPSLAEADGSFFARVYESACFFRRFWERLPDL
jgi:hypothetical protein